MLTGGILLGLSYGVRPDQIAKATPMSSIYPNFKCSLFAFRSILEDKFELFLLLTRCADVSTRQTPKAIPV